METRRALAALGAILMMASPHFAGQGKTEATKPGAMQKQSFGKTAAGEEIELYSLSNKSGMEASVTNFGATLVTLRVPDKNGKSADVVLGYDDLDGYVNGKAYFGATVGRYANRIAGGKFSLESHTYSLPKNNGNNTLHGGVTGFNKHVWKGREVNSAKGAAVEFSYLSKDGDEGFPGNLTITVRYTLLTDRNDLRIDYTANTDQDTVLNVSNHSYFNLAGEGSEDILGHVLTLHAKQFAPVDKTLIPTGELRDVKDTPLDFTRPEAIGKRIDSSDEQMAFGKGYDHNWVLDRAASKSGLLLAAEAYEPGSGRKLQVWTTEPGIQFYSGNFLDASTHGKGGKSYGHRAAFCLETQHFPDSPNHPNFPSTLLKKGLTYRSTTVFRFPKIGAGGAPSKHKE